MPQQSQETKPQGYPVVLGDQVLFYLKDIEGLSAEGRARGIAERIQRVAEDTRIPTTSVATLTYPQPITLIMAGNELLMGILDEDALAEGRSRQELVADYSQKLKTAIEKYREERSLKRRLIAIIYAVISTLALIAILYFLGKLHHKGESRIQGWLDSRKVHIGIQTFEVVRAERLKTLLTGALKVIRVFIILVIFYTYFHLVLSFFPRTEAFASHLFDYVLVPLKTIGGAAWAQIPNLLFIAIIALITYYALKLMRLFFLEVEKGTLTFKGFYPEWARPTYKICRWLVIAFAAVVAFPYIPGSDSPAFKGISIFVGVLFSLGSSSAIANLVAGFTLTYRMAFKVGDRIKIADFLGDVLEMRLQVTRLRTIKNEEIVVPNSMIVSSHVINYSSLAQEKGLILHTSVTIGYDAPWRQVHAMLLMAAERTSGLLREPPPFVLQKSLDDFFVTYELNAYADSPQGMSQIYSDLHKNIQDAFNEHGVQIMSPHYENDPNSPKWVPKDRWYSAPAKPPGHSG